MTTLSSRNHPPSGDLTFIFTQQEASEISLFRNEEVCEDH